MHRTPPSYRSNHAANARGVVLCRCSRPRIDNPKARWQQEAAPRLHIRLKGNLTSDSQRIVAPLVLARISTSATHQSCMSLDGSYALLRQSRHPMKSTSICATMNNSFSANDVQPALTTGQAIAARSGAKGFGTCHSILSHIRRVLSCYRKWSSPG